MPKPGFRSGTTSTLLALRVRLRAEEYSRCRVSLATTDTRIPRARGCAGRGRASRVSSRTPPPCRFPRGFSVFSKRQALRLAHSTTGGDDSRIKPSTARCFALRALKNFDRTRKPCRRDDEASPLFARTSRRTTPRNTHAPTGKMAMVRLRSERTHRVSTSAARPGPTARLPPFDRRGVPDGATKKVSMTFESRGAPSLRP